MRFEIQLKNTKRGIQCFERLGMLYHENGTKNLSITPACTLFTSAGVIPYVTNDLLRFITNLPNITEIPLSTM